MAAVVSPRELQPPISTVRLPSSQQRQARLHICSICGKTFKRSEHCTRHERGHTHEKPYTCQHCGRRYARKDLVTRHEKSFHPKELARLQGASPAEDSIIVEQPLISEQNNSGAAASASPVEPNTFHLSPEVQNEIVGGLHNGAQASQHSISQSGTSVEGFAGLSIIETPGHFNWREPHTFEGESMMVDAVSDEPSIADSQLGNSFQTLDMFSIIPNGGTNMAQDFSVSTYLFDSCYSQPDEPFPRDVSEADRRMAGSATSTESPGSNSTCSFARLPTVVNQKARKTTLPVIDDETRALLMQDIKRRLLMEKGKNFILPSALTLQRFMKSYLTCFHQHFPILHLPSLDLKSAATPLILSMCTIGALYRLDRKTAKNLWFWTDVMVELELQNAPHNVPGPISIVQSKILLDLVAAFSADSMTERAMAKLGFWATEYRLRRIALAASSSQSKDASCLGWTDWCSREASKRLLYGMFIMSSLLTITYDMSPGFSVAQDLDVDMPDEERLWDAPTAQEWEEIVKSRGPRVLITIRDGMDHLLFGKENPALGSDPMNWSALATTVILHAVNIHLWTVMQFTQSFTTFAFDEQNNLNLRTCLTSQVETGLARCYNLLTADRSEREHSEDDSEGPLIFNCLALLRSAYVRVFTGSRNFNRMMLLSDDWEQITNSLMSYVRCAEDRSPFMTKAISQAYGGLLTSVKSGYLLVRKTAALSWSVEHAITTWDYALFVTKWIHFMEMQQQRNPPDEDELNNLNNFKELLTEVDSEYNGRGSLAAEVTSLWASFFDDTWVWGITPRMGQILRKLSSAFEEDWKREFPNGNEAGPISR